MEIQNLNRRNSEYALTESQRELESQRQQLLEANQSKLDVREYHLCSELETKDHLHQECVNNYHGIIVQLHFIDQRQAELQNELYVEQKKRHQPYDCNLDRMVSGRRIL